MKLIQKTILFCVPLTLSTSSLYGSHALKDPFYKEEGALILVQPPHHAHFKDQINDLYLERYKVFKEKLGWDIPVQGNKDIDQYDTPKTTYLIYQDKESGVCGGMRLLPTTGDYMLKDTFADYVPKGFRMPNDPQIWDLSRFFFTKPRGPNDDWSSSRRGTILLTLGVLEYIVHFSPKGMVTLTEPRTERIVQKIGLPLYRIGPVQKMGDSEVVCLYIKGDADKLAQLKHRHHVTKPILWAPLPIEYPSTAKPLASKL